MKISLVIPTNGEEDFGQTLYDAMNQTVSPDEVIVANSGSRKLIENNYGGYIREIFVFDPTPGRARNAGIASAQYDIIIGIDSGCFVQKDFIKHMVDALLKHDNSIVWCNHVPSANSVFEECTNMVFSGKLSEILNRKRLFKIFSQTRGFAIRKSTFEKTGGFPAWLKTGEDILFSKKIRELNITSVIADKAKLSWYPRDNFAKTSKQYFEYGRGDGHSNNHVLIQCIKICIYTVLTVCMFRRSIYRTVALFATYLFSVVAPVALNARVFSFAKRVILYPFFLPLILIVKDMSSISGFIFGLYEKHHHRAEIKHMKHEYMNKNTEIK